jgi:hypothetical protein
VPVGSILLPSGFEQADRARLARLATQARESGIFFRLQLTAPPRRDDSTAAKGSTEMKVTTAVPTPSHPIVPV